MGTATAQRDRKATRAGLRLSTVLIAGAVVVVCCAEVVAAFGFSRISRIERRTQSEIQGAIQFRGIAGHGPRRLLLAGNSLMLQGVDFPLLERGLAPAVESRRLGVEQTVYLDWYYALRMLFARGGRPEVVALELNASQLLSNAIRGDYSANRLFLARDLVSVARNTGMTPTQAASLWFAHYSEFFGTRAEIRKWLLATLMPSLRDLQPHLVGPAPPPLPRQFILEHAGDRLTALRKLAEANGARFILLTPATLSSSGETEAMVESARLASVEVLAPLPPGQAPPSEFGDGFHLNATGATHYTTKLIPLLRSAVLTSPTSVQN